MPPTVPNMLTDWSRPNNRLVAGAAGAALLVMLFAWLLPVRPPDASRTGGHAAAIDASPPAPPPAEDLTGFLSGKRWGESLADLDARMAKENQPDDASTPHPPNDRDLNYVGLLADNSATAVLFTLRDGRVIRLRPGERLPDGRLVAGVAANTVTLRSDNGSAPEDVLELFPPLPPAGAGSQPDDRP